MSMIIGPSFSFDYKDVGRTSSVTTVLDMPISTAYYDSANLGDPVILSADTPHDIPVPIPFLPGLDEIELAKASFSIATAPFERKQPFGGGTFANGSKAVSLAGTLPGQTVNLTGILLETLSLAPPTSLTFALKGADATMYWRVLDGEVVTSTNNPGGAVQHLHILIRPGSGATAGPPTVAVPRFDMPGAGKALYGPALGGATLSLKRHPNGKVNAVLNMSPSQPMISCTIVIGTVAEGNAAIEAHKGLPTELRGLRWSISAGEGRFDTRTQAITVTTHAGATMPDDGALVAEFDKDPGENLRQIEFAPAARVALAKGYPTAGGNDLGLTVRVQTNVPGAVHLPLGTIAARYVQRPLPRPSALVLQGAIGKVAVPLPSGLRPIGMSFRVDGRFGPARLTLDADSSPAVTREGYRIAGPLRVARNMLLNPKEQTLPLSYLAIYGRASEAGELLVTRHGGDGARIGPAMGPPVSIPVAASDGPDWHRVAIGLREGLPPHQPTMWITVQATKGVFWWYLDAIAADACSQKSTDGGSSWATVGGRPFARAWVDEVDPATGDPAPLYPLSLGWDGGVLNPDIVGVGAGLLPPDFTRLWVAEGPASTQLFNSIGSLSGPLNLSLQSRRDVSLNLTDLVLTYDPWTAEGTP